MRAMSAVPCLFLASALGAGAADLPRIDANARVAAMVTNAVMRKDSTALAAYLSGRDSTWEWRTEFWGKHTLAAAPLAAMTGDAAFRANVPAKEIDGMVPFASADGRPCTTWLPLVRDVWEYPSPY